MTRQQAQILTHTIVSQDAYRARDVLHYVTRVPAVQLSSKDTPSSQAQCQVQRAESAGMSQLAHRTIKI